MAPPIQTDVLIIGAGPTGLALACQFIRYGIEFVIIDKNEGVTPYSKAIGVQARTLEIYEQLGLAEEAINQGTIAGQGRLLVGGTVRGELNLANIGAGLSPYPFVLMLEQSKNERLLYDYLQHHGQQVHWQTELEQFSQTDEKVTAIVKTPDGTSQIIEAQYLVGCDGAKSPTRHALGLCFEGSTFERMFFVADAQIEWSFSHDALHVCLAKDSFVVFFPLKGNKRYRIVGVFPPEFSREEGDVLYEEIEQRIKQEAKLELDIHTVEWFSTYKVHTRHVSQFSAGRSFLAGDAAHIHSPAGAQGMNTGIQDSYNLAWKLALVLRGQAAPRLLETYNEERLEDAKNLLQTTDRMFQLAAGSDWWLAFLRTNVVPSLAKHLLSLDAVKHFIFPTISQIGINYRHSSLSRHAGDENFTVKAGDRLPYFQVDGQSIYDKMRQPKFHWLVFTDAPVDIQALRTELASHTAELVDITANALTPAVTEAFGTNQSFNLLVRPDHYIGFISTGPDVRGVQVYLGEFMAE